MTDSQIEKIIETLLKSPLTGYYIAQKTGITEQTILNYRNRKTFPTNANAKLLEYFFKDEQQNIEQKTNIGSNIISSGNKGTISAPIDNRQYYSDSPDVLRATIDQMGFIITEKDERIREKDERIREKDERIKELMHEKEEIKEEVKYLRSKYE
jgi:transcriptional regulator with XRE-family HTH domain